MYPLVQITMGTASLMPSAAFFPFRLHCASLLIALSRQTKIYIPVATLLLEVCARASVLCSIFYDTVGVGMCTVAPIVVGRD